MASMITVSISGRSPTVAGVASEQAQWQEIQQASAERINLYEEKVSEVIETLHQRFINGDLQDIERWPLIKFAYIGLIDSRFDDELAETWYNSIFCGLFNHDQISDGCMFIHTTRPALRLNERAPQVRSYHPRGDLERAMAEIFDDYKFEVPYENRERDEKHLLTQLRQNLPDWVCKDPELCIELFSSRLYPQQGCLSGRAHLYPRRTVATGAAVSPPRRAGHQRRCSDHR